MPHMVLVIAALILFVLDACKVNSPIGLTPLGLFCWLLSTMV